MDATNRFDLTCRNRAFLKALTPFVISLLFTLSTQIVLAGQSASSDEGAQQAYNTMEDCAAKAAARQIANDGRCAKLDAVLSNFGGSHLAAYQNILQIAGIKEGVTSETDLVKLAQMMPDLTEDLCKQLTSAIDNAALRSEVMNGCIAQVKHRAKLVEQPMSAKAAGAENCWPMGTICPPWCIGNQCCGGCCDCIDQTIGLICGCTTQARRCN